jgi:hypothetical protein
MVRMPKMLAELDAASFVLREAKRTVVTGRQGRPTTTATMEPKEKVNALMRFEKLFKVCELFAAVKIGNPAVMSLVVELGYRTVRAT